MIPYKGFNLDPLVMQLLATRWCTYLMDVMSIVRGISMFRIGCDAPF